MGMETSLDIYCGACEGCTGVSGEDVGISCRYAYEYV